MSSAKKAKGPLNSLLKRINFKFTLIALILVVLIFFLLPSIPTIQTEKTKNNENKDNNNRSKEGQSEKKIEIITLPEPDRQGTSTLEKTIDDRRSIRTFQSQNLSHGEISQLLWAGQGITDEESLFRATPSAGATYPLELYIVDYRGVYNYKPEHHRLELIKSGDFRKELAELSFGQSFVEEAPMVIVISAVYDRTTSVYGKEEGKRYVHMEVGHCAQNIILQSVALGLDSVPVGAFSETGVQDTLSFPDNHKPLYLIPVG